jgi:hypothetical protein
MTILKCYEAEAYGRDLGSRAANTHVVRVALADGGALAEQPSWKIADHATRTLEGFVQARGGCEMGAYEAFRRGYNAGIGFAVFGNGRSRR